MAAHPPTSPEPRSTVFRLRTAMCGADGWQLDEISASAWQEIVGLVRPLQPANASVRLLVLQGRGSLCESVDALQIQTDGCGFLLTWHAEEPPPLNAAVIDLRKRFLSRYLSHRHSWQPGPALVADALVRAGYLPSGASGVSAALDGDEDRQDEPHR